MAVTLSGVWIEPPAMFGDHQFIGSDGKVFYVEVPRDIDYLIGSAMLEMGGMGRYLIPTTGRDRSSEAKTLELHLDDNPRHTLYQRREALEAQLGNVRELWRPDGTYLPLYYAQVTNKPAADASMLEVGLKPKLFNFRNPVIDDVPELTKSVNTEVEQSNPGVPIIGFGFGVRTVAPLPFARLEAGTLSFGAKIDRRDVMNLASVGSGIVSDGSASSRSLVVSSQGSDFIFDLFGTRVVIPEVDGPGFDRLHVWAVPWRDGQAYICLISALSGWKVFGPYPVNITADLDMQAATLGDMSGFLMPGATDFGLPFVSPYPLRLGELKEKMTSHLAAISFDEFTAAPVDYALELTLPNLSEVVAGRTVDLTFGLKRIGGFLGDVEWLVESDNPALRVSSPLDVTDPETAQDGEYWSSSLTVEESAPVGLHTISVTVRAALQATNDRYANVITEGQVTFAVKSSAPVLAAGYISAHTIYDPKQYRFDTMKADSAAGNLYPLALSGLARYSVRGDAVYLDGSNISGYGPSIVTVDDGVSMAADFTRAVALWENSAPVGTVFFGIASKTVKNDWIYVYKDATGIRMKVSGGGITAQSDTSALTGITGISQLAISFDKINNRLYLINARTGQSVFTEGRNWLGSALFTAGGLKLSDASIIGLSEVTLLGHASHARIVSNVQLERQAALLDTYDLRTSQWAQPEYPAGCDYIFEALAGEIYRNRHPATVPAVAALITAGGPTTTNDSFTTDGVDDVVRTPYITRLIQNPNDAVIAMRNFASGVGGVGRVRFGMAADGAAAIYARAGMSADGDNKMQLAALVPNNTGLPQPKSASVQPSGQRAYGWRFRSGRFELEDIAQAQTTSVTLTDASTVTGKLLYSYGATARGTTVIAGTTQFFGVSETMGFALFARVLTTAEKQAAASNLVSAWDYSGAPVGGVPDETTPPVNPNPPTNPGVPANLQAFTAYPLASYNAAALYPSGDAKAASDRLELSITKTWDKFTTGGNVRLPKTWNGDQAAIDTPAEVAALDNSGAYVVERNNGIGLDQLSIHWRGHKDPRWLGILNTSAIEHLGELDYRGWVATTTHARNLTGKSTVLAAIYGINHNTAYPVNAFLGERLQLEAGCGVGGPMHAAWCLYAGRSLGPGTTYADTSHKLRCLYVKHTKVMWDEYHAAEGTLLNANGSRKYPEVVRRGFLHTDTGDWLASLCWALIETEMYKNGQTAAITVTMPGLDYTNYGSMVDASRSFTLGLHSTASANLSSHQGYQQAKAGFLAWYNSSPASIVLVPKENFTNPDMRTRFPDGALVMNTGNRAHPEAIAKFAHPSTYHNETDCHLFTLYLEGVITDAFGSQAAADLFMRRMAAGRAIGPMFDTPTTGRTRKDSLGKLAKTTTDTNGVTATTRTYGYLTPIPEVPYNYDEYGDNSAYLRDCKLIWMLFDESGYIQSAMNKLILGSPTHLRAGAETSKLMNQIYRNGRGA